MMGWIYEKLIVFVMVIAMIAGFLVVAAPPTINSVHDAPAEIRWQVFTLFGISALVSNAISAFGFLYIKRCPTGWHRLGLPRSAWLFLFWLAYSLGLAMGGACLIAANNP